MQKYHKIKHIYFQALMFCILFSSFSYSHEILLLKPYQDSLLHNSLTDYLVSEKLDGVRAIWDGKNLKTRNNIIIAAPQCWLRDFPPFKLDGELWTKRDDFSTIISIVKQKNPTCESWNPIRYYIFDVIPPTKISQQECDKQQNLPYCTLLDRLQILKDYLTIHTKTSITIIKQQKIDSNQALQDLLQQVLTQKGEGLVIRKNNMPYEYGRSNNALKLKKTQDSECKVIGYTQGKGKFSDKMGAIICEQTLQSFYEQGLLSDSNPKQSLIRFKIGTGFDSKTRENPPKIGSIITYKFQGFTTKGLPRFPVFLRIYQD